MKTQCALCGDMVVANKMSYHIQQVHTRSEDRPHKCPTCGNFTQNLLKVTQICSNLLKFTTNLLKFIFFFQEKDLSMQTNLENISISTLGRNLLSVNIVLRPLLVLELKQCMKKDIWE